MIPTTELGIADAARRESLFAGSTKAREIGHAVWDAFPIYGMELVELADQLYALAVHIGEQTPPDPDAGVPSPLTPTPITFPPGSAVFETTTPVRADAGLKTWLVCGAAKNRRHVTGYVERDGEMLFAGSGDSESAVKDLVSDLVVALLP